MLIETSLSPRTYEQIINKGAHIKKRNDRVSCFFGLAVQFSSSWESKTLLTVTNILSLSEY